jgi:hypothetical protein
VSGKGVLLVLGCSMLAIGVALVLTSWAMTPELASVDKTFRTPLRNVTVSCGAPSGPARTDLAQQPDARTALAEMTETSRDIALTVWEIECETARAQARAPATLLVLIGVVSLGAGAVLLVVVLAFALWRRRQTGGSPPGPAPGARVAGRAE